MVVQTLFSESSFAACALRFLYDKELVWMRGMFGSGASKSPWLKSSEQQVWSSLCSAVPLSSEAPDSLKELTFIMGDPISQNGFVEVFSHEAQRNLKNGP